MKTKISFQNLTEQLVLPVQQSLDELQLTEVECGVKVFVQTGDHMSLCKTADGVTVTYSRTSELFRALSMLSDFIKNGCDKLEQTTKADLLSYMADMSRNAVYNIPTAKKMIRMLAYCGYNSLMLYTEDTYEVPEYPYFGYMRGRFTQAELKELDAYALSFGIELIPCIQTLAHLNAALQWPVFKKICDIDDILLVDSEETYTFIEAMIRTCAECYTSRRINIGMDEAHNIGRGKFIDQNGYQPKPEIILRHLRRVVEICKKYGFYPMMWSDMFFRMQFGGEYYIKEGNVAQEVIDLVPPEVQLVYWDYYVTPKKYDMFRHMVDCHKQFNNPIAFAGGVSKWYGAAPLNEFSINSTRFQMDVCLEKGVRDYLVTAWGDAGADASQFSIMPSMLYFAEKTYFDGEPDNEWLDVRCNQCFGMGYDDLMKTDVPNHVGVSDGTRIAPCNYLVFNDPLNGLMDKSMIAEGLADHYRRNAATLKPLARHASWGYLFDTLYRMCDLLIEKCDLSIRIRRAYKENDRDALAAIANTEIALVIKKLDAYIKAFRRQWYLENKSFGFDVHEIRLGGLRQRLLSAKQTINDYLAGKVEHIEELEQEQLLFPHGTRSEFPKENPYTNYHRFAQIITAQVM